MWVVQKRWVCRRVSDTWCSGWNIDYLTLLCVSLCEYLHCLVWWKVWWRIGECLTRCWVLRVHASEASRPRAWPACAGRVWVVGLAWSRTHGTGFCGRGRVVGCRPYVENYTVDASIFVAQVFKGARWMPWHQEPKKDVGICDKPRGVDNQTLIRGFPNGETRLEASPVTPV